MDDGRIGILPILFDRGRFRVRQKLSMQRSGEFKESPSCLPVRRIGNRIERGRFVRRTARANCAMQFCITFRTHRAVVPVMTATRSRKTVRVHMRARCTRLPPSSVDARTDNRYSVTPTLAGDKGLNGRPADARVTPTVMHRRNAPTKSVDLERAAPHRALSIRLFVLRDEGAVPRLCAPRKRPAHARAYSHTRVPHGVT